MTVTSALKLLKPLVKAFDHNLYHPPTVAHKRAMHMQQAIDEEYFSVYDGTDFIPKVEKIDLPPLTFTAGGKEWTSYAIRPRSYMRNSLKPGDRVVFRDDSSGLKRLHMIYDHRFFLEVLQPLQLLRAVALGDQHYTGGFGRKGLYKDDWNSELIVPALTMRAEKGNAL